MKLKLFIFCLECIGQPQPQPQPAQGGGARNPNDNSFLSSLSSYFGELFFIHLALSHIEFNVFSCFAFKFTQANEQLTLWYVTLYRVVKVATQEAIQEAIQEVVQEVTAF